MSVTWFHYFILYYLLTCVCLSVNTSKSLQPQITPTCDSEIYCQGDLLRTVQMSQIFNDSKTFVDMSLKRPPTEILKMFKDFMKNTGNKVSFPHIMTNHIVCMYIVHKRNEI